MARVDCDKIDWYPKVKETNKIMKIMTKKFLFAFGLLLFLLSIFLPLSFVLAQNQNEKINVYFFWGEGCPHCEEEKSFLEKLERKYPNLEVYQYEAWNNKENRDFLIRLGKELEADVSGVPFTVIGEQYFIGWYNEEVTGSAIEKAIECALEKGCLDVAGKLIALDEKEKVQEEECECEKQESPIPSKIKIPVFGEIEIKNFSLPLLSVVLGALDGFNPCAMWALLFLISLLLGMKDKKRMWILGSVFIITSAVVYFMFMAAWLNLLLFVGFIVWVRIIIGMVALGGGAYNLREYFINRTGCPVTGEKKRKKVFEKLKAITQKRQFWLALGGIIILAGAVNLVELICSAGLPVVFTQILALSHLVKWQYYLYMLLYIFVFMLDDLFVFFVAMITLQITGITTKYSRWSHLIGGVLMVIIGILLIFKPEWLMF